MMKRIMLCVLIIPALALAQSEMVTGKATPKEVYQKVTEAAQFLSREGKNGLKEFESANGKFVWKDSFVWVTECEKNYCLPTPGSKDIGLNLSQMKCYQTGKLYILSLCDEVADHPSGAWVEYWLPREGFDKPQRKVSFMMQVPNSPYQVVANIFDNSTTMDELDRISGGK